jgi:hypothetical protein
MEADIVMLSITNNHGCLSFKNFILNKQCMQMDIMKKIDMMWDAILMTNLITALK